MKNSNDQEGEISGKPIQPTSQLMAALLLVGCAALPTQAVAAAPTTQTRWAHPVTAAKPITAARTLSWPAADTTAASDKLTQQAGFARWVANFQSSARAAGIREATLQAALADVQYLPQVVALDRAQPEFTRTVWQYLDNTVTPQRITLGKNKLKQVRHALDAAAARYGVPPAIVVAIWGMESNFGINYGSTPTLHALATLGYEGRREAWARRELLAALQILDRGDIDRRHMIGSWAGAMGQTQFLPSNFLAYAVDADGDGQRDIWRSMADVAASTANFLAQSGWKIGQPWGVEVQLPADFDYARADMRLRQSSAQWAAEGLRTVDAQPLPALADSAVLLPAGAHGPAFLVGPNFDAILRYNNSTSYALAVSLLAQRLTDGPGVQAPWPRDLASLSRSETKELQNLLNQRGFDAGTPDGMMGPATRDGIRQYQLSAGLPADAYPSPALLQGLRAP